MDLEEFQELKEEVEREKRRCDRAEGVRDQILAQLRKEHGFKSLEEAKKFLRQEEKLIEREGQRLEMEVEKFRQKWKEALDEPD